MYLLEENKLRCVYFLSLPESHTYSGLQGIVLLLKSLLQGFRLQYHRWQQKMPTHVL